MFIFLYIHKVVYIINFTIIYPIPQLKTIRDTLKVKIKYRNFMYLIILYFKCFNKKFFKWIKTIIL